MKIVIAPDKFKGTLSATKAAEAIAEGVSEACAKNGMMICEIITSPMADGGEGSVDLIIADRGRYKHAASFDALMRPIETSYGITEIDSKPTAVIESASTAGLFRLSEKERNPLNTTSYGLGIMLSEAISNGYYDIAVTVGGTATNDCGTGMLAALGCRFYDCEGNIIEIPTGGSLAAIYKMDAEPLHNIIDKCRISVLCDVENPLLGELGAAAVFSPQKGADMQTVSILEQSAEHFSQIAKEITGHDYSEVPGTGAGGGIAWALKTFCAAEIVNGAEFIAHATGLCKSIAEADLVITGEGGFDTQSLRGKVVGYVAATARKHGIPVTVICAKRDAGIAPETLSEAGITSVLALIDRIPLHRAMNNTAEELKLMTCSAFLIGNKAK